MRQQMDKVTIIGGWHWKQPGNLPTENDVVIYEMRPNNDPAHHTNYLAELVCSNLVNLMGGKCLGL